jgi:membrane-associated protease RseP (regulator of RpoE activity)
VLGSAVNAPLVDVHPLTVVGWMGLVITALNLMPAGQLDGVGLSKQSMDANCGEDNSSNFDCAGACSSRQSSGFILGNCHYFLQRDLERPSLNELSEPDDARAALALLALFLMIVTLLPLTPSLAGRLGIGS